MCNTTQNRFRGQHSYTTFTIKWIAMIRHMPTALDGSKKILVSLYCKDNDAYPPTTNFFHFLRHEPDFKSCAQSCQFKIILVTIHFGSKYTMEIYIKQSSHFEMYL